MSGEFIGGHVVFHPSIILELITTTKLFVFPFSLNIPTCVSSQQGYVITFFLGTCQPFRLGIPVRGVVLKLLFGNIDYKGISFSPPILLSSCVFLVVGLFFYTCMFILVEFLCCSAGNYWGEKRYMTLCMKPLLLCGEEQKYLQGQVSVSVPFFVCFGDTWYCK